MNLYKLAYSVVALLFAFIGWLVMIQVSHTLPNFSNIVVIYRGMWLVIYFICLFSLNVLVWEKFNINYAQMLEIDARPPSFHKYLEASALLATPWFIGIISYTYAGEEGLNMFGGRKDLTPLILSVAFWSMVFWPFDILFRNTRWWVLRHLARIPLAPFVPVTFASFWLADQFISLTVALMDLEYTLCFYTTSFDSNECKMVNTFVHPMIMSLPYMWRFVQCLRVYYDAKNGWQILNAGKYATSLVVILFATLHNRHKDETDSWTWYRSMWVTTIIFGTLYSYVWDVVMDWGLGKLRSKHFGLRDYLHFEKPFIYYTVLVTNFCMRLTWVITLSPLYFGITVSHDQLLSVLASIEVTRRIIWNFFRVENEFVNTIVLKAIRSPKLSGGITKEVIVLKMDDKFEDRIDAEREREGEREREKKKARKERDRKEKREMYILNV